MKQSRFARTAALALAVCAITAPVAGATTSFTKPGHDYQDLRSPDTRDRAEQTSQASPPRQDLRSPDTRDLADGRTRSAAAPDITVVKTVEPVSSGGGLDVGDAGIGAGIMLGLILVALGGSLAVMHRRRQPAKTS